MVTGVIASIKPSKAIGVPYPGYWKEIINSNANHYGGDGTGNLGGVESEKIAWDGHHHSLKLTLPANSTSVFKFAGPASS